MVYWFSKQGFGQSDGIEYSKDLVVCAKSNMNILKKECSIINVDATEYQGYSDYNYFYFANPFGKETMRLVIRKIEESYRENPRKMVIIYYNPLCHKEIIESGFFRLEYSNENNIYRKITGRVVNVYSNFERITERQQPAGEKSDEEKYLRLFGRKSERGAE